MPFELSDHEDDYIPKKPDHCDSSEYESCKILLYWRYPDKVCCSGCKDKISK